MSRYFSEEEKLSLANIVSKKFTVMNSGRSGVEARFLAWVDIAREFNETNSTCRSKDQLRRQWSTMKARARRRHPREKSVAISMVADMYGYEKLLPEDKTLDSGLEVVPTSTRPSPSLTKIASLSDFASRIKKRIPKDKEDVYQDTRLRNLKALHKKRMEFYDTAIERMEEMHVKAMSESRQLFQNCLNFSMHMQALVSENERMRKDVLQAKLNKNQQDLTSIIDTTLTEQLEENRHHI